MQKLFERFREFAKEHPERMVNPEQVRKISGRKRAILKKGAEGT
jgi:hypothetical protein